MHNFGIPKPTQSTRYFWECQFNSVYSHGVYIIHYSKSQVVLLVCAGFIFQVGLFSARLLTIYTGKTIHRCFWRALFPHLCLRQPYKQLTR